MALLCLLAAQPALAQPLTFVNEETEVRDVDFRFTDTQTFDEPLLKEQIAVQEPGFGEWIRLILPFVNQRLQDFMPVEVARDIHRLESFYRENGFLHAEIDYRGSELDTTDNHLRVVYTITEGPPVLIQDVDFTGPDGQAAFYALPEELREEWVEFREEVSLRTGDRYTTFDRIRIADLVVTWLKNRGFAFAEVSTGVVIDSLANTADLTYAIDPGLTAYIDDIVVEGNRSVSDGTILREMPFDVGDRFSARELTEGQRELYALNLFRVATITVPDQPHDSTVSVLIQVREGQPRYISAQVGYAVETGATAQAQWTHRNFLGGARLFTAGLVAESGVGATFTGSRLPQRLYRVSASLTQPYVFTRRLSLTVAPYYQVERDPDIQAALGTGEIGENDLLNINVREAGITTTFLYGFFRYRSLQLRHLFSRALIRNQLDQFIDPDSVTADLDRDVFDRSIFSLTGVIGRANDYLDPTVGFIVRPFAESGGAFLASDIEFLKAGSEVTAYRPLAGDYNLRGRLFAGRIWPYGYSRRALLGEINATVQERWENRFETILFYAGGQVLRGWPAGLAGEKEVVPIVRGRDTLYVWDPEGGLAHLGANVELRMPFPRLGPEWGTAVFADAAVLDRRTLSYSNLFADVGAGIRYRTLIGSIRLDLAYKLNPRPEDLWKLGRHAYEYQQGLRSDPPEKSWLKRFNVVLSVGPAF